MFFLKLFWLVFFFLYRDPVERVGVQGSGSKRFRLYQVIVFREITFFFMNCLFLFCLCVICCWKGLLSLLLLLWEFFTSSLADGLPLKFEWHHVSPSFQDSSQYYGRSKLCGSSNHLHSSSNFQILQFLYQSFGDCTVHANYNWYHHDFHVPQFFLVL